MAVVDGRAALLLGPRVPASSASINVDPAGNEVFS